MRNIHTIHYISLLILIVINSEACGKKEITLQEAQELIGAGEKIIILDVRESEEFQNVGGHIPEALNYPWDSGF